MIELPKIGEKCLHRRTVGESFREGECVGHDGCLAIIRDKEDDTYTGCCGYQLSSIKTEAEKWREEQIKAICQTLNTQGIHLRYLSRKTAAEALYNSGCRMARRLTESEDDFRAVIQAWEDSGSGWLALVKRVEDYLLGEN